jgi:cytochrome b
MLHIVRGQTSEEETMFSTWDRYPAAAGRWLREAAHGRKHPDPMANFLTSIDVMIYLAGTGLAACVLGILLP